MAIAVATLPGCDSSASSTGACTAKDVTLQLGQPVPDGGQYLIDVFISNVGKAPCTIDQRPTVQLQNDDTTTNARTTLAIAPSGVDGNTSGSTTTTQLVVPGGGSVIASLTYLAGPDAACDANGAWVPTRMAVTPAEGLQLTAGWPGQSVDDCQEGNPNPGNVIGPFAISK